MIIKSIRIQNFRCLKDVTLTCEMLTMLIGPNGSGKSSVIRSLEFFYKSNAKYTEDDFYDKNTNDPIVIAITFSDLTSRERNLFSKYIKDSELIVEKVMYWPLKIGSQKYYGKILQNPDFGPLRYAKGAQELKSMYNKLKENNYSNFPNYSNQDNAIKTLQNWEENNPDKCKRKRDDGKFFGFEGVGISHLEQYTQFINIPAVKDASADAMEGKDTPLSKIMDLVVRSVLAQKEEITKLREVTQNEYNKIMDSARLNELRQLEIDLRRFLKIYLPEGDIILSWATENLVGFPLPSADIKLLEDEYESSVERTGHGTQRAFILTMLHYLADVQSRLQIEKKDIGESKKENSDSALGQLIPNLIIGIEEPELYQHPNRQRYLYKTLLNLSKGSIDGVAGKIQIIYSTHSPLFVDIIQSNKVRVFSKVKGERDKPKHTRIINTNLDKVVEIIEKISKKPKGTFSSSNLEAKLKILMTPWMNEGFFAKVIVLVEGEQDRAVIIGSAEALGYDFEGNNISVIPCMGKGNLIIPTVIFNELKIPIYVIWDSDYEEREPKKEINLNNILLRFFEQNIEDWPDRVKDRFACFKRKIEFTLRSEIGGELYDEILSKYCEKLDMKREQGEKNPKVIQEILSECKIQNRTSNTIEKIIEKIISLTK